MFEENDIHLSHFPQLPPVDIEFHDMSFSVPQGSKGTKMILRGVNGQFRSGELTAILGPSGAGKSTLLNLLAGYKWRGASGSVFINGSPRDVKSFKKISRYIMQEDLLQPMLTIREAMQLAADLKLGPDVSFINKQICIEEILDVLRLNKSQHTPVDRISGGERKRLSIALELINNPSIIFLDEPTTGLDDVAGAQCIRLLRLLARGGRTVICSLHTPSARLFELFNHVYVVASGQCVFAGTGSQVVPYIATTTGLQCPTHYNPADFVIEVASGEYGDFTDKLVSAVDNGKCLRWSPKQIKASQEEINTTNCTNKNTFSEECNLLKEKNSVPSWYQFQILLHRMLIQMWRDSNYLLLKAAMYAFLGLTVGLLFWRIGNDGSKTLFNFGFCFTCLIVFMYVPMMPILLYFPTEVRLLKREHFNQWYGLNPYFCAMTASQLPANIILGSFYIFLVYFITDQPLELQRIVMFFTICVLIGLISESFGLIISSQFSILNGMFVGPAISVPFMLLAVYGLGTGSANIPVHVRYAMALSYLRYGLEGIISAMYGGDRAPMPCPDEEIYCMYSHPKELINFMGMENVVYWFDLMILILCFLLFRIISFYLLRQRLSPNKTFAAINYIGRIVKSHFNSTYR